MEQGQLRWLPAARPLVERLGEDFFREVPRRPGVYRMYDADGTLVYVGKAADLRARLGSYRRTNGQSRKTIRLIHAVWRIEWDLCDSETAARLRENELIRTLRPRFNRAGIWPKSARYVRWDAEGTRLRLSLVSEPSGEGQYHGPFRGGPGFALAALARLAWLAWERCGVGALPRGWIASEALRSLELDHARVADWTGAIRDYFAGTSDELVARLVAEVEEPAHRFDVAYVARQFEILESFYRAGPLRIRRLRARFGGSEPGTPTPEILDDWKILAGGESPAPPFRPPESGLDDVGGMPETTTLTEARLC
ncbi:MAG: GIY-YIG nuclease family protein [Verrucomicrobiales bacterium]|nr:GIY-YIG nuclease family protein [Verrucomicrobiales bacterium]